MLGSCPFCGSIYWGRRLLCVYCCRALSLKLGPFERKIESELTVNSLFKWIPGRDDLLSLTLMALKQKEDSRLWSFFAEKAVDADDFNQVSYIVPVPSRRVGNHALGFANALSNYIGAPVIQPLTILGDPSTYKTQNLNRAQRAEHLKTRIGVKNTEWPSDMGSVLIVDDIVTTGATIKTVAKLLNMENKTKIWTIASRSLAGE